MAQKGVVALLHYNKNSLKWYIPRRRFGEHGLLNRAIMQSPASAGTRVRPLAIGVHPAAARRVGTTRGHSCRCRTAT